MNLVDMKEARKNNNKLKRKLDESQQDNDSIMEEWENDLNEYQNVNPLGMTGENYKRFENDMMSKFEKERMDYFNNREQDDYDEEEEDYSDEPMEYQPFGGNGNDPDIIYD